LPEEVGQNGGEGREPHCLALLDSGEGNVLCESRLSHPTLASEEDIFSAGDEVEAEQKFVEGSVDDPRMIPVEGVERRDGPERCRPGSTSEVSGIAFAHFEGDELFGALDGSEAALGCVGEPRRRAPRAKRGYRFAAGLR